MIICCIQPSYIPWKGYFHQIEKADVFVFLDTVQYDRRGWRNRNQLKTAQGPKWLTIPVNAHGSHDGLKIKDVKVASKHWAEKHLQTIQVNYRKAPCFETEFPWIETMLLEAQRLDGISDIDCLITEAISRILGVKTRFVRASQLDCDTTDPNQRLLHIVQALEGTTYLSGPSAQNYLDVDLFKAHGINVAWMTYDYPEYDQLYPPFTHQVSILDLILTHGTKATPQWIWSSVESGKC